MRCISSEVSKLAMRKICLSAQGISGMKVQIGQKWEHMSCRMEEEIAWIPQNPMLDLAGHTSIVWQPSGGKTQKIVRCSERCETLLLPNAKGSSFHPKDFCLERCRWNKNGSNTPNLLQGLSYCPSNFCHERCIRNKNGSIGWQRILSCNL